MRPPPLPADDVSNDVTMSATWQPEAPPWDSRQLAEENGPMREQRLAAGVEDCTPSDDPKNRIGEIFVPETPNSDSKINIFSTTHNISPGSPKNNLSASNSGDFIDTKVDVTSQNPFSDDDQIEVFDSPSLRLNDKNNNSPVKTVPQSVPSSLFENDEKSNKVSKTKNGVAKNLSDVSKNAPTRVSLSTRKFSAPKICRWAKSIIAGTDRKLSTLPELQNGAGSLQNMMGLVGSNGISEVNLSTLSKLQEVNLPENVKNTNRSNFDMGIAVDRKLDALFGGARGPMFEASLTSTMAPSSSPSPPTPFTPEFTFAQNPSLHPQNFPNFNFNGIDSLNDIRARNQSLHLPLHPKSVPITVSPSFPLPHSSRPPPPLPSPPWKRSRLSNFPEISSLNDKNNIRFSPSEIAKLLLLKQETFALPSSSISSHSPPSISPSSLSTPSLSSQSISQSSFPALSALQPSTSSFSLSSLSRTRSSPVPASPTNRQRLKRFPSAPSPFSLMDSTGLFHSPLLSHPSDSSAFSSDLKRTKFDPEVYGFGNGSFEVKEMDKNGYNSVENGGKMSFRDFLPSVGETNANDLVFTAPFILNTDEGNNRKRSMKEIQDELKAVTEIDTETENGTQNRLDMTREIGTELGMKIGTEMGIENGLETIIESDPNGDLMSMGQMAPLDLSNRRDLDLDLAYLHGFSSKGCSSSSPDSFICLDSSQNLNSNSNSSLVSNSNLNSNSNLTSNYNLMPSSNLNSNSTPISHSNLSRSLKRGMENLSNEDQFQCPDFSRLTQLPCQETIESQDFSTFSDFDIIQQQQHLQRLLQKYDNFPLKDETAQRDKILQNDKCAQNDGNKVDLESNSLLDYLGFKWPNIGKGPNLTTDTNTIFEKEGNVLEGSDEFSKTECKEVRRGLHEENKLGDFYLRTWNARCNK